MKDEEHVKDRAGFDVIFLLLVVVFIKTSAITWHCMPVNNDGVHFVKGKNIHISNSINRRPNHSL